MTYPKRLSPSFSSALRQFSYWVANGSVGDPLLAGVDYWAVMAEEPSLLERAYAIFGNVIELDAQGTVTNARQAEVRAAQYIRAYCDQAYVVDPPFQAWELELY